MSTVGGVGGSGKWSRPCRRRREVGCASTSPQHNSPAHGQRLPAERWLQGAQQQQPIAAGEEGALPTAPQPAASAINFSSEALSEDSGPADLGPRGGSIGRGPEHRRLLKPTQQWQLIRQRPKEVLRAGPRPVRAPPTPWSPTHHAPACCQLPQMPAPCTSCCQDLKFDPALTPVTHASGHIYPAAHNPLLVCC